MKIAGHNRMGIVIIRFREKCLLGRASTSWPATKRYLCAALLRDFTLPERDYGRSRAAPFNAGSAVVRRDAWRAAALSGFATRREPARPQSPRPGSASARRRKCRYWPASRRRSRSYDRTVISCPTRERSCSPGRSTYESEPILQAERQPDFDRMDDNDNRLFGVTAQIMWLPKPSYQLTLRTPLFFVRN